MRHECCCLLLAVAMLSVSQADAADRRAVRIEVSGDHVRQQMRAWAVRDGGFAGIWAAEYAFDTFQALNRRGMASKPFVAALKEAVAPAVAQQGSAPRYWKVFDVGHPLAATKMKGGEVVTWLAFSPTGLKDLTYEYHHPPVFNAAIIDNKHFEARGVRLLADRTTLEILAKPDSVAGGLIELPSGSYTVWSADGKRLAGGRISTLLDESPRNAPGRFVQAYIDKVLNGPM